jgi:hypothetical protein
METLVLFSIPAFLAVECLLLTVAFLVFCSPPRTRIDVYAPLVDRIGGGYMLELLLRPRHAPRAAPGSPTRVRKDQSTEVLAQDPSP